jgi:acyl carrier protein
MIPVISSRCGKEKVVGADREQSNTSNVLVLRQEFPLLGAYVAPRTPIERKLAEIFCNALHMDKVSVNDDFEELGGDSLVAVSICADIEKAFTIKVPIAFLVRAPTIGQLAPRVDELVSRRKT